MCMNFYLLFFNCECILFIYEMNSSCFIVLWYIKLFFFNSPLTCSHHCHCRMKNYHGVLPPSFKDIMGFAFQVLWYYTIWTSLYEEILKEVHMPRSSSAASNIYMRFHVTRVFIVMAWVLQYEFYKVEKHTLRNTVMKSSFVR